MKNIGLLGTSANPAHNGHVAMANMAKKLLGLDEVWLVVTPQNPFKETAGYAPLEHRLAMAEFLLEEAGLDWLKISTFEIDLHAQFLERELQTTHTLRHFKEKLSDFNPVWLMGADNLTHLHTWDDWEEIMQIPMGIFYRHGHMEEALASSAATLYKHELVLPREFKAQPNQWCLLEEDSHLASSTEIRAQISGGDDVTDLPVCVQRYIATNNLYKDKKNRNLTHVPTGISQTPSGEIGILLRIKYKDVKGRISERDVIFTQFHGTNVRCFMEGYCLLRQSERQFRIDRVLKVVNPFTGEIFSSAKNLSQYILEKIAEIKTN